MVPVTQPTWEHFDHGADIGTRGKGETAAQAFEGAALGLTAVLCSPEIVQKTTHRDFECEAPDLEILLLDWLNALVACMATENLIFGAYEVSIEGTRLTARAWGERVDPARHHPAVEVKGATFTELRVCETPEGWIAQCVLDV
jgi:SHS2 domain-containing protein